MDDVLKLQEDVAALATSPRWNARISRAIGSRGLAGASCSPLNLGPKCVNIY